MLQGKLTWTNKRLVLKRGMTKCVKISVETIEEAYRIMCASETMTHNTCL